MFSGNDFSTTFAPLERLLVGCILTRPPTGLPPVLGNDFSTIFAPLVRDGRMDKYYWQPTQEDLIGILHQASVRLL